MRANAASVSFFFHFGPLRLKKKHPGKDTARENETAEKSIRHPRGPVKKVALALGGEKERELVICAPLINFGSS